MRKALSVLFLLLIPVAWLLFDDGIMFGLVVTVLIGLAAAIAGPREGGSKYSFTNVPSRDPNSMLEDTRHSPSFRHHPNNIHYRGLDSDDD